MSIKSDLIGAAVTLEQAIRKGAEAHNKLVDDAAQVIINLAVRLLEQERRIESLEREVDHLRHGTSP